MRPAASVASAAERPARPAAVAQRRSSDRASGRDAWWLLAGLIALIAWDASSLDMTLARVYGGPAGFEWRQHWLTSALLHDGGRWLALAGIAALMLNLWKPLWRGPTPRQRLWWLAVTLACMLVPPLIKQHSLTSCPWSLAEFGGVADHVSHWALGVRDHGPGGCFPSGHAASAAAFFSGWFVLRRHRPRAARWWLAAVLALTAAYGWAQLARGAHYASHTLWTAWICYAIGWAAQPLMRRGRARWQRTGITGGARA